MCLVTPMVMVHVVHPTETCAETCGLDDVFPPDDVVFGSKTHFDIGNQICYHECILSHDSK